MQVESNKKAPETIRGLSVNTNTVNILQATNWFPEGFRANDREVPDRGLRVEPISSSLDWRLIANPHIATLSQLILDVFASCGRITGYPEVIP